MELAARGRLALYRCVTPRLAISSQLQEAARDAASKTSWNLLARLGSGAFEGIGGEVVSVVLFTLTPGGAVEKPNFTMLDASETRSALEKARLLLEQPLSLATHDAGGSANRTDVSVFLT